METTQGIWSTAAGIGEFGDDETVFIFTTALLSLFHQIHRYYLLQCSSLAAAAVPIAAALYCKSGAC
jgi:hypothetical protein